MEKKSFLSLSFLSQLKRITEKERERERERRKQKKQRKKTRRRLFDDDVDVVVGVLFPAQRFFRPRNEKKKKTEKSPVSPREILNRPLHPPPSPWRWIEIILRDRDRKKGSRSRRRGGIVRRLFLPSLFFFSFRRTVNCFFLARKSHVWPFRFFFFRTISPSTSHRGDLVESIESPVRKGKRNEDEKEEIFSTSETLGFSSRNFAP